MKQSGNVYIFYGKRFWSQITLFRHAWQIDSKDIFWKMDLLIFSVRISFGSFLEVIQVSFLIPKWCDLWRCATAGEKRRWWNVIIRKILCFFEFRQFDINTLLWHTENAYLMHSYLQLWYTSEAFLQITVEMLLEHQTQATHWQHRLCTHCVMSAN